MFSKFFATLSDTYKFALTISVFFLINSVISMKIDLLPSFASYIVGFAFGILCGLIGMVLLTRRMHSIHGDLSDNQVSACVSLIKLFAGATMPTLKKTPFEIARLVCDAKDLFPDNCERSPIDSPVPTAEPAQATA